MARRTAPLDLTGFTKKERIAFAREIAAMKREEAAALRRRNKALLITGLSFATVVVLGLAALTLYGQYRETLAGPTNMASDGVLFTGDGTTVTAVTTDRIEPDAEPAATTMATYTTSASYMAFYLDIADADSRAFWTANSEQVQSWLLSGYVALEIHPIASSSSFSKLAANAIACVADGDPDNTIAVLSALVTTASADGFTTLDADGVLGVVSTAGVSDADVQSCVSKNRFASWVTASTARAKKSIPNADVAKLASTPTALVDGNSYTGDVTDADAFYTFITSLYPADDSTDTGTDESTE